ncbi:hypothetical protein RvY_16748 [Ramazzottius varieornatus]|uniref:Uncharacterized protein n=1 Tax=Ramazzottius varieornatus TaxID=947166 RepID=A0A1D1VZN0_RAMVA|nr:hypothetical protein RvY_16748 [Ramazzottius varieornatus]
MPLLKEIYEDLASSSSDNKKARILAVSTRILGLGCMRCPLPRKALLSSNLLDNNAFRVSVGILLGAKLCRPHICHYGASGRVRSAWFELQIQWRSLPPTQRTKRVAQTCLDISLDTFHP